MCTGPTVVRWENISDIFVVLFGPQSLKIRVEVDFHTVYNFNVIQYKKQAQLSLSQSLE